MIKGKRKRKEKGRKARLSFLFLQSIQASSMRIFTCLHMYVVCMAMVPCSAQMPESLSSQREWESGSKRHVLRMCRNVHLAFIAYSVALYKYTLIQHTSSRILHDGAGEAMFACRHMQLGCTFTGPSDVPARSTR